MKRREYFKTVLILGGLGITSVSFFKWFELNKAVNVKQIADKRAIIAELAETIIPATDTPGAKDVAVHDYIINVMINCNGVKEQNKFLSGINDLEEYSVDNYGRDFLKCNAKEKHDILQHFAKNDKYTYPILNKINDKFFGQSFYLKLKSLTVEGYCLSKPGATQAFAYDYIPGSYEACIPLKPNQKSWATK